MNTSLAIIAAFGKSSENDNCLIGWWRSCILNCVKYVMKALSQEANDKFYVKIITSATKDSTLLKEITSWGANEIVSDIECKDTSALMSALQDCHTVFALTETDYNTSNPLDEEFNVGRAISDACLAMQVKHVIFSSRVHVNACIGLRSDACDGKAHISDYMDKIKLPRTILYIPFLYEDFLCGFLKPRSSEKANVYKICASIGHIPLDMIAAKDVGYCVKSLLSNPSAWIGKSIALSGDKKTIEAFANNMTDIVYPAKIVDGKVTPEEFMELYNMTGAEDMANYFDLMTRSVQKNSLDTTMKLYPMVTCFYDWIRENQESIKEIVSVSPQQEPSCN